MHFADNLFKYIFMNENFCLSYQISQNLIPKGPIDNKSTFVQVLIWYLTLTGAKPLSEVMLF